MPLKLNKISLIYFILATLLIVGLVPLLITGWVLSERSARELRAVEGRYQTQLVQDKARQIEMFGQRYTDLVGSFGKAFELSGNPALFAAPETEQKLGRTLQENPNLVAIHIKPVTGEPLSLYRAEEINQKELDEIAAAALAALGEQKISFGAPRKLASGGAPAVSVAVPVSDGGKITAAVVAVISLREIGQIMAETKPMTERQLWEAGLPIVFVVDREGRAVFHPDAHHVAGQKPLTDLKIVQEWMESSRQIQSALVPFSAEFDGSPHEMIGAYSTANFTGELSFGVIAMQDESRALASVGEMRRQTWMISLALAVAALIIGSLFARQLSLPVHELAAAAERIASGDLSTRVEAKNVQELDTLGAAFNTMSDRLAEQIAQLAKAAEENRELFVGTVKALAAAIDGKDRYTRGHSERVSRISVAIGRRMGLNADEVEKLRISALLHDVGKIAVNDTILNKPDALTDQEFEIMKTHPYHGYKIMSQIPAMHDYLPGIYMHHEMINGGGYPQGIKGDEIPLQARIVSVADTFDAMTTDRPYQKGMTVEATLNRIKSFVGMRYDGKVVEALVQACDEGQIGAGTVKLRNPPAAQARREVA